MATLRLFAQAREAAGERSRELDAATVGDLLDQARARYGDPFGKVLDGSAVWLNGHPADASTRIGPSDEVAVLPPVSGGA
ncbi:MAG TPA: MoaD/ThiS family protein [Acidimicrobiales bacterium]|nr:MoaD/ThiS family protein [Acidimicrobiales bacterium]